MNNSSIQYTFVMKIVAWSCSATFESNVYMFFHPVFTIHSHLFINLRIGIGKKVYFIALSLKSNKTIATQIIIMWAMSILEHIFVIVIIFKKKKKKFKWNWQRKHKPYEMSIVIFFSHCRRLIFVRALYCAYIRQFQLVAIELNWTKLKWTESNRTNHESSQSKTKQLKPKDFFLLHLLLSNSSYFIFHLQNVEFASCVAATAALYYLLHCGGLECSICALKATWAIHANRLKTERYNLVWRKNTKQQIKTRVWICFRSDKDNE